MTSPPVRFGHRVTGELLELVRAEVARDVRVALLQQQQLRRRIGDMAHHDARISAFFSACGLASAIT